MNNNGAGYPAFLSVCQKCFAEFAAGMAANNLEYFLPRHVRGKKYLRGECFSAHFGRKSAGFGDFTFVKKAMSFFDKQRGGIPCSFIATISLTNGCAMSTKIVDKICQMFGKKNICGKCRYNKQENFERGRAMTIIRKTKCKPLPLFLFLLLISF